MDKTIIKMAKYYVHTKNATLKSTAEKFSTSSSAVGKYFTNELKFISPRLYGKVEEKKARNVLKSRKNFTKSRWLFNIFKKK